MEDAFGNPVLRPAWARIDMGALLSNYRLITEHIPAGVKVLAMVKADAYGHGASKVARALEGAGVRALGVATVEEGIELRDAGIAMQILVMGGLMGEGSPASRRLIEAGLTPVIHSRGVLAALEDAASQLQQEIVVHLQIDTGMSRLGVRPETLPVVLRHIRASAHVRVEGVMTHLADAHNEAATKEQYERFSACHAAITEALGEVPIWHMANSIAISQGWPIDIDHARECWVRPGLSLYGDCEGDDPFQQSLKPVMSLMSRVMLLKHVPAGTKVSYGGTFTAGRDSYLAIVPIGYADGYPWSASGKAEVLIRGQRVPIAGRVTMDMVIVDVTDLQDVSVGDDVVLMGQQGAERIGMRELASWAGTLTYEILCGISKRVPRIYKP